MKGASIASLACQDCGKPLQQINVGTEDFIVPLPQRRTCHLPSLCRQARADGVVVSASNSASRRIEKWVFKVQRFASTVYRSPHRLFSLIRSLPSSLKRSLRRKLLSLLDIKTDIEFKDSSYISFVGDYIGGGITLTDCTQVTITNCSITAPPGTTPLVAGGSKGGALFVGSNPSAVPALGPPPELEVIERPLPIVGFRGWLVVAEKQTGFRLGSTGVEAFWEVGVNKAACMENHDHPSPAADCGCGLYLMRRLDDVSNYAGSEAVYGAVVSWGRIIEHTDGFRAEYARPLALIADSPLAEIVGKALGLPVVAREYLENYAKEFGEGLQG